MRGKVNFIFKVIKGGKTIDKCRTHLERRFYDRIGTINWENGPLRVCLRVSYGIRECNRGCACNFYNDGEYRTKQDLLEALKVFTEEV